MGPVMVSAWGDSWGTSWGSSWAARIAPVVVPIIELFGINIAQELADAIEDAGNVRVGSLVTTTSGTRSPGDLSGGTNPTNTTHSFNGFVEERSVRRQGALVAEYVSILTVLGESLDARVVPAVNDESSRSQGRW